MSIQEIIAAIKEMKMTEVKELVDAMKEEFGVTGAIAVAGGAAPAAAAAAEEKTEFDVVLKGFDAAAKLKVLKVIREVCGLGLKEAKDFVEAAAAGPKTVKEGLSKEDAEKLAAQIKEVGGEVEIK
ncbi:MAG: 50S ribosomal protein L7/L12 [Clostridiales bacterium]|nr:50S ribosomal protein L7/L12 [Clostridiales bacterium]